LKIAHLGVKTSVGRGKPAIIRANAGKLNAVCAENVTYSCGMAAIKLRKH